jgi:hypothetical protein
MKPFYEKNTHIVSSPVNITFEEVVSKDADEFDQWVRDVRAEVLRIWDTYGLPPRSGGKTEDEIIENFNRLGGYNTSTMWRDDEEAGTEGDVILNTAYLGVEADQFFENMYKTRIIRSSSDTVGQSIYDLFNDDKYLKSMLHRAKRHFKRDSFYLFAMSLKKNDAKESIISVETGKEWVDAFFESPHYFKNHDFFLEEVDPPKGKNAGYFQLDELDLLHMSADEVKEIKDRLEYRHHSNIDIGDLKDDKLYRVRMYEKGKKVFPRWFIPFRIGYTQPAVNFPPLTAKAIYERFTHEGQHSIVWDPSSGWGGRILGAMSVADNRTIRYVGTDPNPDNFHSDGTSKYHHLADFFNTRTYRGNAFFSEQNTYELNMLGSEEMADCPSFQKYKGEIDLVFTSPPYFNREVYSEDENQSCHKYGDSYDSWKNGFLIPTLKTAAEWLKPGGYLLWNIADLKIENGEFIPLEEDSVAAILALGLEQLPTIKMAMTGMPGTHRLTEDGKPHVKNFCKVAGRYYKYEPIFVFRKT